MHSLPGITRAAGTRPSMRAAGEGGAPQGAAETTPVGEGNLETRPGQEVTESGWLRAESLKHHDPQGARLESH